MKRKYIKVDKNNFNNIIKKVVGEGFHTIGINKDVNKINFPVVKGDVFVKTFYNEILKRKEWQFTTRSIERSYGIVIPYGISAY